MRYIAAFFDSTPVETTIEARALDRSLLRGIVVTFEVGRDDGGAIRFAETLELCEEITEK